VPHGYQAYPAHSQLALKAINQQGQWIETLISMQVADVETIVTRSVDERFELIDIKKSPSAS